MKTDDKFNFFQNQLRERNFFVCLLQKQRNSAIADARAQYTPVQLVSFLTVVTPKKDKKRKKKKDKKEKQNKTTAVDARELNCGSLTSTYATHWARRNLADLMRIQLPHKVPGFMAHLGFQAQNVSTQLLFFEGGLRTTQLELESVISYQNRQELQPEYLWEIVHPHITVNCYVTVTSVGWFHMKIINLVNRETPASRNRQKSP